MEEMINKKIAALEVYKELKTVKLMSLALLVGVFLTAIAGILSKWAGAACVAIFSSLALVALRNNKLKINYLDEKYKMVPPKDKEPFIKE